MAWTHAQDGRLGNTDNAADHRIRQSQPRSNAQYGPRQQRARRVSLRFGPHHFVSSETTIYAAAPARQPISQKSASSRVASLKIATSSASRIGVTYRSARLSRLARALAATSW